MTPIILFCIGIALILVNYRAIKNEKKNFNNVLNHASTNIDEVDVMIGDLRREFSETILELQKEIQKLKEENHHKLMESNNSDLQNIHSYNKDFHDFNENNDIINNINKNINAVNNSKVQEISEDIKTNKLRKLKTKINKEKSRPSEKEPSTQNENGTKVDQVQNMLSEGHSVEEIAEKLDIGKGEVLLVKELYRK
ncbi:MAG: hypothetical protein Q8936_02155 [Bacillota bacterium]|nr:hypothetical protein [Bacillota bacterium]